MTKLPRSPRMALFLLTGLWAIAEARGAVLVEAPAAGMAHQGPNVVTTSAHGRNGIVNLSASLSVDCNGGSLCDFARTAGFRFGTLPIGLSWNSESGKFLTNAGEVAGLWFLRELDWFPFAGSGRRTPPPRSTQSA